MVPDLCLKTWTGDGTFAISSSRINSRSLLVPSKNLCSKIRAHLKGYQKSCHFIIDLGGALCLAKHPTGPLGDSEYP